MSWHERSHPLPDRDWIDIAIRRADELENGTARRVSHTEAMQRIDEAIAEERRRPRYAIFLDFDEESDSPDHCRMFESVADVLDPLGFTQGQPGVYFGNVEVTPVRCVLAAMELARRLAWFRTRVRSIQMLRIDECNDLMPAVQQATSE